MTSSFSWHFNWVWSFIQLHTIFHLFIFISFQEALTLWFLLHICDHVTTCFCTSWLAFVFPPLSPTSLFCALDFFSTVIIIMHVIFTIEYTANPCLTQPFESGDWLRYDQRWRALKSFYSKRGGLWFSATTFTKSPLCSLTTSNYHCYYRQSVIFLLGCSSQEGVLQALITQNIPHKDKICFPTRPIYIISLIKSRCEMHLNVT